MGTFCETSEFAVAYYLIMKLLHLLCTLPDLFDCSKGTEYRPHPTDCGKYIWCTENGLNEMKCPNNTYFDPWTFRCNHISIVLDRCLYGPGDETTSFNATSFETTESFETTTAIMTTGTPPVLIINQFSGNEKLKFLLIFGRIRPLHKQSL